LLLFASTNVIGGEVSVVRRNSSSNNSYSRAVTACSIAHPKPTSPNPRHGIERWASKSVELSPASTAVTSVRYFFESNWHRQNAKTTRMFDTYAAEEMKGKSRWSFRLSR
jgi:hypothetical protein